MPSQPGTFEIFREGTDKFRFRLRANNGEIVAASEGYSSKEKAKEGVEAVKAAADGAATEDLT